MATLVLGSCDKDKIPLDRKKFLAPYHRDGVLVGTVSFRDDDRTSWCSFREDTGNEVTKLQQFLTDSGFMPRGVIDGIFDYVTQAAVRLFQEYVRTVDINGSATMEPDGIVGPNTMAHISRWQQNHLVCEWGGSTVQNPTSEFSQWMDLLNNSQTHYSAKPGPIMKQVSSLTKTGATIKVKDWDFDENKIHLVGIRRKQDQRTDDRINDDLFILLVRGMVFKFWGSTDPSVRMAKRADEAFLVEGQHKYRFGWHKISDEKKIYRAMKPYNPEGVLVLRDWDNNNALTEADLLIKPVSIQTNNSINIHWSGVGGLNYSAGCQVIAGKSYINHANKLIDCSSFASNSYGDLNSNSKKTKGAYNVLADLVVCYSAPKVDYLLYTLGRESSLNISDTLGTNYVSEAIKRMNPAGL